MKYYKICPEVPGDFGGRTVFDKSLIPWSVTKFHLSIDGWLGGDLLTTTPVYYVTENLKNGIKESGLTGIKAFEEIEVSPSDTFMSLHPNKKIPPLYMIRFNGVINKDDFYWESPDNLLISEKALLFIRKYNLSIAKIQEYQFQ